MRVNVYAEEITDQVEIVTKPIGSVTFAGVQFHLELPATVDGKQYRGPFLHRPGDDDSSGVTLWGKGDLSELRAVLAKALDKVDEYRASLK